MPVTAAELDALARHADQKNWGLVPEADKRLIRQLWTEAKECSTFLVQELDLVGEVRPHTSHPTPNGRSPADIWGCVYPLAASNKSFAFQLFFLFAPGWVEYGFAAGAGEAQIPDKAILNSLDAQFAAARSRLLAGVDHPAWLGRATRAVEAGGFSLRDRWRGKPMTPASSSETFPSLTDWIRHVASGNGDGASISAFISRDDLVASGDDYREQLRSGLQYLAVLFDLAHPKRTKEDIARSITDALGLQPVTFSTGSTEPSELFTAVIDALGLTVDKRQTKDNLAGEIARLGGEPWDKNCYSAGSTVTHTGLERVLCSRPISAGGHCASRHWRRLPRGT